MKRAALYNPFLDVLGGGEKHILSIMNVLLKLGIEVNIFWDRNLNADFKNRFSLTGTSQYKYLPNIFNDSSPIRSLNALRPFDYFFYVTNGSYFASAAKKNFVFAMVPDKKLYNLNLLNRLKLWNYRFISNSPYTTRWLNRFGIDPVTIPPFVDDVFLENNNVKKEKIILSVGRFFPHLHSKNQEKIIEVFKRLKRLDKFKDYKLVLAGGLKSQDQKYFDALKALSGDKSIIFKPNVTFPALLDLYRNATYFWHFTGMGIDEEKHPEMVEHFGIAPLEAMASGCLVFCHNSGGPKEIMSDNKTGFLFDTTDQIIENMKRLESSPREREAIIKQGISMVKNGYNYQMFEKRVSEIL